MNDDELTTLAATLRELREEFDEATARAAFDRKTADLHPDQRARVEALVFFGDGSQVGDVKIGDVAGGAVVKGVVNVTDQAQIYGPVIGDSSGTVNVSYTYTAKEHQRRLVLRLPRNLSHWRLGAGCCCGQPGAGRLLDRPGAGDGRAVHRVHRGRRLPRRALVDTSGEGMAARVKGAEALALARVAF